VRAHDGRSFWGIPRPDCEACADRDEGRAGEPPSPRPRIRWPFTAVVVLVTLLAILIVLWIALALRW